VPKTKGQKPETQDTGRTYCPEIGRQAKKIAGSQVAKQQASKSRDVWNAKRLLLASGNSADASEEGRICHPEGTA
jgi:hypothetical protein